MMNIYLNTIMTQKHANIRTDYIKYWIEKRYTQFICKIEKYDEYIFKHINDPKTHTYSKYIWSYGLCKELKQII
jgi:hypothetical protein